MLRHGQTDYNAHGRMQGQLDTELSPLGIEQAHSAAQLLKGCGVSRIVSSDLLRARHTAEIVAATLGLEIALDSRLRETHLGQWQGKTRQEVDAHGTGIWAHWRNNPGWAPPAGESRLGVAQRTRPVVDELMASYDEWGNSAVLLVAHGGSISALTSHLLGFSEHQYLLFRGLKNTSTSRLTAQPVYRQSAYREPGYGAESTAGTHADTTAAAEGAASAADVQWYLDAWNQGMSG